MKNYILIGVIIFAATIAGYLIYQSSQTSQTTFSVFQDRKDNPKTTISINNVDIPLDKEEACVVAKESCNSPSCLSIKTTSEIIKEYPAFPMNTYQKAFGDFNFVVELEPVCGPTTAFILEDKKEIVCFCAYE